MSVVDIIQLGVLNLRETEVQECSDCHSRDIVKVLDKRAVSDFIRTRAMRIGLSLDEYDVKVDKNTGVVTARAKAPSGEVDFDLG